jgi:hypothetical protein
METKDNVISYRSHRVGSVTAGLSMVGIGVMFLLHLFFDLVDYRMMFSLWPVMLILLGLELLLSNFSKRKIVYDKAAIFLLILMTFFSMGMAVADLCFRWADLQMWRYY